jgi:hypothetical protein
LSIEREPEKLDDRFSWFFTLNFTIDKIGAENRGLVPRQLRLVTMLGAAESDRLSDP